jgi:hypothetical protein
LLTLWTKDDLIFIPERYRIQFTFISRVYCWTGVRLSALFTNGLRYRDVELVLQRTPTRRWKLIYRIDQRWVKNNRDPENIVFGTAGREHDEFIYDDAAFLLNLAMVDRGAVWVRNICRFTGAGDPTRPGRTHPAIPGAGPRQANPP